MTFFTGWSVYTDPGISNRPIWFFILPGTFVNKNIIKHIRVSDASMIIHTTETGEASAAVAPNMSNSGLPGTELLGRPLDFSVYRLFYILSNKIPVDYLL